MAFVKIELLSWMGEGLADKPLRLLEREVADGTTLRELLAALVADHPPLAHRAYDPQADQVSEQVNLLVNDVLAAALSGLDTPLHEGDKVTLLPAYAGGAAG